VAAPKGNQFWKARSKHGRDKIFSTDKILREGCEEYFQWCEDNPLKEGRATQFQGEFVYGEVSKMRAMTIAGLCIFLDICETTWAEYRKHEDFTAVITRVEAVIYAQKFVGAAADLLNPNIIARDLGLRDNQHIDIADKTDSPDEEELDQRIAEVLAKLNE